MKHKTKLFLTLALVATAVSSIPGSPYARESGVARPAELGAGAPTLESWWGAAAAAGCRQGFRYIGTPGFNMFSGFCVIALLDAIF